MARIVRTRILGKPRPLFISLAVTARCNLRCSFCFGRYYEKDTPDLSQENVCGLIDHLAGRGMAYINFSGGEPLMREDIGAIIRCALGHGIFTSLTTNGILIDRYLDVLALLDFVCVSVDGDEASHDRVRGAGTHKIIMDNIRRLRQRNVPVQVTCLLNRYNAKSMRWLFESGRDLGFTVKLHIPNEETEFCPTNPDVGVSDEEIRNAIRNVIAWQREGLPVEFSSSTYKYVLWWPRSHWKPIAYRGEEGFSAPWPCYAGRYWCQIDADGKVYPCCAMFKNFAGLDFREVGFDRAFAHTATRSCVTCAYLSNNEFNQLIALRGRVIAENAWRSLRALFKYK